MLVGGIFIKGLFSLKWLKMIMIAMLWLCLCVLPICAETVDAVQKDLVPMDGIGETAHMTCAQCLPQNDDGSFSVYLEFSDLPEDLWLEAKLGVQMVAQMALEPKNGMTSAWIQLKQPVGTVSLELSFYDEHKEQAVYQSLAFALDLQENLSFELADAMACTPTTVLSILSKETSLTACLPLGTEDPAVELYGQMVDKDGTIYGTASQPAEIADREMADSRFQAIFRENPYKVFVQGLETQIALSKLPEPGSYDLIFVDAEGKERYHFPDVVQCDDRPTAQLIGWTAVPGSGTTYAEVMMQLANGSPEAFTLQLYRETVLLGTSEGFHVLAYEPETDAVYVSYPFLLEEPLEPDEAYLVTMDTALSYHGQAECALEAVRAECGTIYGAYSGFDSAYFANVLVKTSGFEPGTQYKAVLWRKDERLAQSLVTVGEQGWLDIAFTDEENCPISVTPEETYRVSLYRWESGGQWVLVDETPLRSADGMQSSEESTRTYAQADGLLAERVAVNHHLTVTNGDDAPILLQLFGQQNQTNQPDYSMTLAQNQDYTITDEDLDLFSAQRYRAVYLRDSQVVGVDTSGYWVTGQCMDDYRQMQDWGLPNFEITVAASQHGTLQLFGDDGNPVNHKDWLNFTEIYVHAVPEAGYVLDTIYVNDKPITGRAFLLAENSEVRATFTPRQVETFSITLQHNAESDKEGGLFHCALEQAALGDLVTLTAQPEQTVWLTDIRVFETETRVEVPLEPGETPNTWQFVMPGTAVTAEVIFTPKILAEIVVESYDLTAGLVAVQDFGWEGDTVTVTTEVYEGCSLQALWLVYEQAGKERTVELLEQSAGTPGCYWFRVPAADKVYIRSVFYEYRYAVALPEIMPTGGSLTVSHTTARPGSCVTITVIPDEKFRLTEGSLGVRGEDQTVVPLTMSEKPLTWTFIMPWKDVQISAAFEGTEPEVVGITAEQLGTGRWKLAVQVKNATTQVSLAAALYDETGKLLGAELLPCSSGEEMQEMILSYRGKPATGRLFFLKTDGLIPTIDPIQIPLLQ